MSDDMDMCACGGHGGENHEYGSDDCQAYWAKPQQDRVDPPSPSEEFADRVNARILKAETVVERVTVLRDLLRDHKGPLGMPGSPLHGAGMADAYKHVVKMLDEALHG